MKKININLGARSYPIYVGDKLIHDSLLLNKHISTNTIAIISNTTVAPLYLDIIISNLGSDKKIIPIILPDGEQFKNAETLNTIYDCLIDNKCDREVAQLKLFQE